jgi:hypothetical protein
MIRRGFVLLGLLATFSITEFAQTEPEVSVQVELTVRGPDARPVANRVLEIKPLEQAKTPQPTQSVITNSAGVARFTVRPGNFSLAITVQEVGYGITAPTSFEPGEKAHPALPLLAGYGSMDGTTPSTCAPEAYLTVSSPVNGVQRVRADKSGHFHVPDLAGGDWSIFAGSDDRGGGACGMNTSVYINVGKDLKGVTLSSLRQTPSPQPATQPQAAPMPSSATKGESSTAPASAPERTKTIGHPNKSDTPIVWAQGTVTDEGGHPIENANVYALGTYHGGMRMLETGSKATTDKSGHYELKGAGGLSYFSAALVAIAPGHPPAWAWPAFPQNSWFDSNPSVPEPVTQNMVLPSKSGRMTVTIVHEGNPVPGAVVAAYLESANLRDIWAKGFRGELREEIENVAYPASEADPNGNVTFANLLPGRYTIYALAQGKIADLRELKSFPEAAKGKLSSTVIGIPVQIGQETRQTLSLYEEPNTASFTVLNRDGAPQQGNVPIQFGPADTRQAISSVTLNSDGHGNWDWLQDGLSEMRFIHKRDSSTSGWRSDDFLEPFDSATALVASSPNLPAPSTPTLRMRRVEPSAVDVVVQDGRGTPVRATVSILQGSYPYLKVVGTGSADKNGEIEISGLESATSYDVHVTSTELTAMGSLQWDYQDGKPLPMEETRTRQVFVDEPFVARRETRTRIVIRPEPVGYVFGNVHSAKISLNQVGPWLDRVAGWETKILLSPTTGEFIAGPLRAGRNQLHFRTPSPDTTVVVPIEIDPAKEQQDHLDIDIDKYLAGAQETTGITGTGNAYMGMGGITTQTTGAQHLIGTVFLSDGKTPALGAEVLYFEPGSVSPTILALTDALGALRARGLWRSEAPPSIEVAPFQPVVVALLPGECGATISTGPIHRDKPLRLILPPAISLKGKVTVGGTDLTQRPGVVHIVAEYQDKGLLNAALSVKTTADAEGNFILAGLTPGSYLVQAALDDIWMSPVTMIRIGDEKLQPLHIAIRAPGAPVQITLVDRNGKPDIGRAVTLGRSGPLSHLWPEELRSDGAGLIYIPTMESGLHLLHVDGVVKPVKFDVPPLPAAPIIIQVQTSR